MLTTWLSKTDNYLRNLKPERFFLVVVMIFGLLFIVITPPFQGPDEPTHFYRAYQISEGNFVQDKQGAEVGGVLPVSVGDTVLKTSTNPTVQFAADKKYDIYKTKEVASYELNESEAKFYHFPGAAVYPPIAYAPQAIGMAALNVFNPPPIFDLYVGRLASLVAWTALIYYAIKIFPRKKWAVVFVGLLPTAVFQASSLSADAMSTGLAILFASYIFRLVDKKQLIKKKQFLIILGIGTLMSLCKQIVILLLPLVLLLPNKLFNSKTKAYLTKASLIALPLMALAVWMFVSRGVDLSSGYTNGQEPITQIKDAIMHPHSYINVLWNTYFFTWGDAITRSFIGTFGWMDAPLSELFVLVGYLALAIIMLANYRPQKPLLNTHQKLILAGVIGLFWLGVSTALYAYYSPVNFKIIVGIQGRYFLPIGVLIIPLLLAGFLKINRDTYLRIATYVPILLLVVSAITIYFRYYINNV